MNDVYAKLKKLGNIISGDLLKDVCDVCNDDRTRTMGAGP